MEGDVDDCFNAEFISEIPEQSNGFIAKTMRFKHTCYSEIAM